VDGLALRRALATLCGSWWQRWGAPATGAAGDFTRCCVDRWALWATGRCATPTKTEHLEIPVGRGRLPRRPLLAEVSSLGLKDAHAMGTRLGAVARRPGPGEHRGRRRMPTAGEHKTALVPASQRDRVGGGKGAKLAP